MPTTYYLIGPDTNLNINKINTFSLINNYTAKFVGDGKSLINCTNIFLPQNTKLVIIAHGYKSNNDFKIALCKESDNFNDQIKIISKEKTIHVYLHSCYSGEAIEKAKNLLLGTTLVTFISKDKRALSDFELDNNAESLPLFSQHNPFIQFVSYIFIIPDEIQILISTKSGKMIFKTSFLEFININKNLGTESIYRWQMEEFLRFISFTKNVKSNSNTEIDNYLFELDVLQKYNQHTFLAQFNNSYFQAKLLMKMIFEDNYPISKNLLESGAPLEIITPTTKYLAINLASQANSIKILKLLFDHNADIFATDNEGNNSLMIASEHGFYEITKFLLNKNSNIVNISRNDGLTALFFAVLTKKNDIIELLISHGADPVINTNYFLVSGDKNYYQSLLNLEILKIVETEGYNWY